TLHRLCFPQAIRRRNLRRESCFHNLNGYVQTGRWSYQEREFPSLALEDHHHAQCDHPISIISLECDQNPWGVPHRGILRRQRLKAMRLGVSIWQSHPPLPLRRSPWRPTPSTLSTRHSPIATRRWPLSPVL